MPSIVSTAYRYRPDIDGLRAVAIVPVVAFHAGWPAFGGGFVGVDVFFVISGYLITGMLLDELQDTGRIRLLQFYARRARRLFPALALVCLVTLGLGLAFLLPFGEQQELAQSAIAASLFSSNFFFWMKSGYFDGPSEQKALLNMWTLSVEEQFYWVWPLLLMTTWSCARKYQIAGRRLKTLVTTLLVLLIVASFWSCIWLTSHSPSTSFFMMPVRGWEFALGGLVAFVPSPAHRGGTRYFQSALGLIALGMIVWSVAAFSRDTPYPGAAAAVPALGAALLIYSGAATTGVSHRLLSLPIMVAIGQLSYSWYLWHWPLIAISRAYSFGAHDIARDSLLAAAALLLALLTFRYVENPIRRSVVGIFSTTRGALVGGMGLLFTVIVCSLGLAVYAKSIAPQSEHYAALLAVMNEPLEPTPECKSDFSPGTFSGTLQPIAKCTLGDVQQRARVLIWGDSYGKHYVPLLDRLGKKHGFAVVQRLLNGCAPLLDIVLLQHGVPRLDCAEFNPQVRAELSALRASGVDSAILSAHWLLQFPPAGDLDPNSYQTSANLESGLRRTLDELERVGFKVLLIAQSPQFAIPVPRCLARRSAKDCGVSRAALEQRRANIMQAMRNVVEGRPNVRIFDPVDHLCSPDDCPVMIGQDIGYRDRGHIAAKALPALETSLETSIGWLLGK